MNHPSTPNCSRIAHRENESTRSHSTHQLEYIFLSALRCQRRCSTTGCQRIEHNMRRAMKAVNQQHRTGLDVSRSQSRSARTHIHFYKFFTREPSTHAHTLARAHTHLYTYHAHTHSPSVRPSYTFKQLHPSCRIDNSTYTQAYAHTCRHTSTRVARRWSEWHFYERPSFLLDYVHGTRTCGLTSGGIVATTTTPVRQAAAISACENPSVHK